MDKEYLIRYILLHEPNTDRNVLELMSFEDLVIRKVQIELQIDKEHLN